MSLRNALVSAVRQQGGASWATAWQAAWARQAASSGQAHVACFGDSITQGYYATTPYYTNSWANRVGAALSTAAGVTAGTGWVPVYEDLVPGDDRLTRVGTWATTLTGGLYGQLYWANGGATRTLAFGPVDCDSFYVSYSLNPSGGAWSYSVDGGAPVNMTSLNASVIVDEFTVDAGGFGSHTLSFTMTPGPCFLNAVEAVRNATTGVKTSRIAYSAKRTDELLAQTSGYASRYVLRQVVPDLALIAFGINEWAQSYSTASFEANTIALIDELRDMGASVVIVVPPPPNPAAYPSSTWANYTAVLRSVAASQATGLVDIDADWVSYAASTALHHDNTHPNNAGHADIASLVSDYLLAAVA